MSPATARYRLVRPPVEAVAPPELDGAQRRVVDHPGGPLLVLAGPGTGKTTTLVEAVVARVERGLSPDQVLVLTFSRKAADELRERITARLGRTVAEPAAFTFHSWCYGLVRAHSQPADLPRLLSQAERDVRIRELLIGHAEGAGVVEWPAHLRPALRTRGFAREVASLFDRARERGLDGVGLARLGRDHDRPAWVAAGVFLDEYLAVLDARRELDYAGLVTAATNLLSHNDIARDITASYGAVFVDEYQDTDPSQERLLQHLAGGGRDLVVVGDPDQAIYAFRGADVSAILEFRDRFPTADGSRAPIVTLDVSRRSKAELIAASRSLAQRITTPRLSVAARTAHRALQAAGSDRGEAPTLAVFPSQAEEVTAIADALRRAHLEEDLPWSRMAVLVRSGARTIPILRRALVAAGVPISVAADETPVARDPAVAPLLTALRIADDGDDVMTAEDARFLLLSPLARALPSALRALGRHLRADARAAGVEFPPPAAMLIRDAVMDPRDLLMVDDWIAGPVRRLHELLRRTRAVLAAGGTPEQALWELWEGSGWPRRLSAEAAGTGPAARNADRDLDAIVALFDAAARLEEREPKAGVGTLLDELGMQDIPAAGNDDRAGAPDAVRLLTAHRSKGLEWDLVVVCGVQEEQWPDLRRRGSLLDADRVDVDEPRPEPTSTQLLVDERRLFYVAITRARQRLLVTAVQAVDDAGQRPSRFMEELGMELPATRLAGVDLLTPGSLVARLRRALQDPGTSGALKAAAAHRLAALVSATNDAGLPLLPVAAPDAWWGMRDWSPGAIPIRDPQQPLRLSGSAVSGYEACPLRWLFEREVHARGETTAAQGFGTVVHTVAQLVADGALPADPDVLLDQVDRVWASLGFEAPWQRDREREEAREALRRFVRWMNASERSAAGAERKFEVTLGDVVLRGAVDRLEIDADGKVHVVDFKTGRNPRRQDDVDVDAQLGVYQLAVREGGFRDSVGGATSGGAELVWLRSERRGGLPQVQQQAALPDAAATWADELIERTAKGVRDESFPARPGNVCGSCAFQSACPAQPAGGQVVG